jgi:hypothetical protein
MRMSLIQEFDRQVGVLLTKLYPRAANMSESVFLDLVVPLKQHLTGLELPLIDLELGTLPFVIVVSHDLISAETMMSLTELHGKPGVTKLTPHTPSDFAPTPDVNLPATSVYLLLNIDRGRESLNIRPEDALTSIKQVGRSPLTIDEGIALITQHPSFLKKNNCFSLLGSRHVGDQRVPAIWINGSKQPNLGWCWDRNPHTWLGSASGGGRLP